MSPLVALAVIGAGGAAAVVRYGVARMFARPTNASPSSSRPSDADAFPWAVLLVNVVGSALGGVVLGLAWRAGVSAEVQLVLLSGVCGGLTTFSTLSVETVQLVGAGRWRAASLSIAANLVLGIGACALGFALSH